MSFERYVRQIMLPEIGENGQSRLARSRVAVIGAGGLGCPCLVYLTLAGVGHITVCDGDRVSLSNLNRQLLYLERDAGKSKAETAAARLSEMNPECDITAVADFLTANNAEKIIGKASLVIDCLDSFADRLVLNDACVKLGKPFIHAGVGGFSGQLMICVPGKTACLRCMGLTEKAKSGTRGIIGAAAGVIGSLQALEAIKILTGIGFSEGALFFDGKSDDFSLLPLKIQNGCLCNKTIDKV